MKYIGKTIALQEEICVKIELEPLFIELMHQRGLILENQIEDSIIEQNT